MKTLSVIFAVLLLSGVAVKADFKFDGAAYSLAWEAETNHAIIKEFFCQNETTNNWTTMVTFQAHPGAAKVKEVSGPYFEARKSIIALPPKIHPKRTNDTSDVVLELFLGAPGKTSHLEFALVRFIETESGIYVVAYSYKLPLSKKQNQDFNVDVVMKQKEKWIRQLLQIPVEAIKQQF
jgi:hypothetical protein